MDKLSKAQRRKNMQAVKSTGSAIETMLAKELWKRGYRYRKNNTSVYGKPDLTFKKLKIAVFVDGEFWHGKDWETRKQDHKSNVKFWHSKIERNMERDKEVNLHLSNEGWTILRFWGKEIKSNLQQCIQSIEDTIKNAQSKDTN